MTPGPPADMAKRARAAELYDRLGTTAAVAEAMGISPARAYVLLKEAGVVLGKPGPRPKDDDPYVAPKETNE